MSCMWMYIIMIIFMIMTAWSSSSWFPVWISLEISTFFFIPLMMMDDSVSTVMMTWKYFIIQSIGSFLFLFSFLLGESMMSQFLLMLSMMIKMGSPPFSSWVFQVSSNMSWLTFFLMSSSQKMIPLMIMCKCMIYEEMLGVMGVVVCVSSFSYSYISSPVRWMIVISSVFNVSWMIISTMMSSGGTIMYFVIYSYTLWVVVLIMSSESGKMDLSCMMITGNSRLQSVWIWLISFLMLIGVPPMGMFMPKLMVLNLLMESEIWLVSLMLMLTTSMVAYLYLKILISKLSFSGFKSMNNWNLSLIAYSIIPMLMVLVY